MSELELKFRIPDAALPSLRQAMLSHGAQEVRLRARYFDTPDGRLARARVALRLRHEGDGWVQTLKAPGESSVHRLEHEVRVPVQRGTGPALDIARHAGSEAARALREALGDAPASSLVERYSTDVLRLRCETVDAAGTRTEIALDKGEVRAGEARMPIAEVELEHLGGPLDGLFDLALAWIGHGGLWLSTVSKAERGERLLPGAEAPVHKARPVALKRHASADELVRQAWESALAQVLANASEVGEGREDAELVHQLRVALRRLRTALRELAGLMADPPGARLGDWAATLAEVFARLGERRDNEVLVAAVQPLLEKAGAPKTAWRLKDAPVPQDVVRDSAFQGVLAEMLQALHRGPGSLSSAHSRQAREQVAGTLQRLHRQVSSAGRRFESLEARDQHRVRKRLKRLRYLAEMVQGLWPAKEVESFLKHLGPAQDALGRHTDRLAALAAFQADSQEDPRSWFAVGFLQASLRETAHEARRALRKVRQAEAFWRRPDERTEG